MANTKSKKTQQPKSYRVCWEIDVDAINPYEAAKIALEIQRDSSSMATWFDVFDDKGKKTTIEA